MDPRFQQLADNLVNYSVALQKGEKVLIDAHDIPNDMVVALVRAARRRKALPYVQINSARVLREYYMHAEPEQLEYQAALELERMKGMQAYIALRGSNNIFEMSDVPAKQMNMVMGKMREVQNWRVRKTKWVVLRWPTSAMAQQALTSSESFEDFYFRVCTLDYSRMIPGQKALKKLMDETDQVHIKGPGTDLRFSIKGISAVMCAGLRNIPDGEVFSCPVRDSVEGVVQYNCPTVYQGTSFNNVRLEFSKGRIAKASCTGDQKKTQRHSKLRRRCPVHR